MNYKNTSSSYKYLFSIIVFLLFCGQTDVRSQQLKSAVPTISAADSARSIKSLKRDINKILKAKHLQTRTKMAVAVYSLTNNEYYYSKNLDLQLTPASTTKLITTFSAMKILGEDFKIKTTLYTDAKHVRDSVLEGNLYIYGRGDVLLSLADIEYLAAEIHKFGIRKINGNIYADGSYFDGMTDRKVYSGDKDRVEKLPPITALVLEQNLVQVNVNAGSVPGELLSVQIIPASSAIKLIVNAKVKGKVRRKKRSSIDTAGRFDDLVYGGEVFPQKYGDASSSKKRRRRKRPTVKVLSKMGTDSLQSITVSGYLKPNKSHTSRYYILNPELTVAGYLKNRLTNAGVKVSGDIGEKRIRDLDSTLIMQTVAEVERPITDLIYTANKESNNYFAETLFKIIGAYRGNYENNAEESRKSIIALADSLKIPFDKCNFFDGSGLSRRNTVTAHALIELLIKSKSVFETNIFDSTLSIAGVDGTLMKRMRNTPAEDNLRAKTGTLRNVSALAGFVTTPDDEELVFAIVFRGNHISDYKRAEDRIGQLLSQFFYFNEEN